MAARREPGVSLAWMARPLRGLVKVCGVFFLCAVFAALLGLPWPVYRWLSMVHSDVEGTPDLIVMMGGGGIPSESGLTRAWQTAYEAAKYPKARVLVAMPFEPGEGGAKRSAVQRELQLRGVSEARLLQEGHGRHSREQAVRVYELFKEQAEHTRVLIVTSPEHVRRSVLAFRKAGFPKVRGRGTEDQQLDAKLEYGRDEAADSGSRGAPLVGQSLMVRYQFWNNLQIEVKVARELAALLYYKAKGWI